MYAIASKIYPKNLKKKIQYDLKCIHDSALRGEFRTAICVVDYMNRELDSFVADLRSLGFKVKKESWLKNSLFPDWEIVVSWDKNTDTSKLLTFKWGATTISINSTPKFSLKSPIIPTILLVFSLVFNLGFLGALSIIWLGIHGFNFINDGVLK